MSTSKSRIKKLVAIINNDSSKDPQLIKLPISYRDLINFAEVLFENNYMPLEVTTIISNNEKKNDMEHNDNKFIKSVPIEPYFNDTIEIQNSVNTLFIESEMNLNDILNININQLIENDLSGIQENISSNTCAEIKTSNSCLIKRKRNVYPDKTKWKRKTNKNLRMKGETCIGFTHIEKVVQQDISRSKRSLLDTCSSNVCLKSKNRFCNYFTEIQRQNIFKHFWNSSWQEKETFVLGTVLVIEVKRKNTEKDTRRSKTYNYQLGYKDNLPLQLRKNL